MIIIDGHNLIGSSGIQFSDPESKNKILNLIDNFQNITGNKIIVVFDGSSYGGYEKSYHNNIEINYPLDNENADQVIMYLIDKYHNQHSITIVSSDNEIIEKANNANLKHIKSKYFFESINSVICKSKNISDNVPFNNNEYWFNLFKIRK